MGVVILALVAVLFFFLTEERNNDIPEEDKNSLPEEIVGDFQEVIANIDTSKQLVSFLNEHFSIITANEEEHTTHHPEKFFQKRGGGEYDFMVFAVYVLENNRKEVATMKYRFEENGEQKENLIAIFREGESPEYIAFDNGRLSIFEAGWSFDDTCTREENRLNIEITEYLIFPSGATNFSDPHPGYSWREKY